MSEPLVNEPKEQTEANLDPVKADYEAGKKHLQQGNLALAANAFHNAKLGFEERKDEEGLANACDKLGDICVEHGDFAKAMTHFEQAFAICTKLDDLMSILSLRRKIALCHRRQSQFDEAIKIYLVMLDYYLALNNPASTVTTLVAMAEAYGEMNDLGKAADTYRTAASIHANFRHPKQAKELLAKAEAIETGINEKAVGC